MHRPNRLAILFILAALPATASPIAEVICEPTERMTDRLTRQYGETRTAVGIRDPEQVMEIWTGQGGESWTMVVTSASGTSCIVAMGKDWQAFAAAEDPA